MANTAEKPITEAQLDNLAYRILEAFIADGIVTQTDEGHELLGVRDDDLAVDLNIMLTSWFTARGVEVTDR